MDSYKSGHKLENANIGDALFLFSFETIFYSQGIWSRVWQSNMINNAVHRAIERTHFELAWIAAVLRICDKQAAQKKVWLFSTAE